MGYMLIGFIVGMLVVLDVWCSFLIMCFLEDEFKVVEKHFGKFWVSVAVGMPIFLYCFGRFSNWLYGVVE